ncbi:CDP-alcohol phosphatidyltransferase family protein [Clostridium sediminicola]|uniref:CDP-alcohol phosphatidyltransferase family protein n=1 Tax=Clostridium sediminicola TaxID=3114879 RepID=UPI0031F202D1
MLDTNARKIVQPLIEKTADTFIRLNLSANKVTVIALIVGLLPSVFIFAGNYNVVAVIILWFSGYLDAVDGTIARKTNSSSLFGTIMDITFDRIVEISLILVLSYKYSNNQFIFILLASSIILSMTIFLTVAAASEKKSEKTFYYQPGLAERTEGFVMFSLMMIITKYVDFICVIFVIMILYTALQRFIEAYKYFHKMK